MIDLGSGGGYIFNSSFLPCNCKADRRGLQSISIHIEPPIFTLLTTSSAVNWILHINTDDVAVTRAIVQAGKLLDVDVLDRAPCKDVAVVL